MPYIDRRSVGARIVIGRSRFELPTLGEVTRRSRRGGSINSPGVQVYSLRDGWMRSRFLGFRVRLLRKEVQAKEARVLPGEYD